jgi:hypothetical protein
VPIPHATVVELYSQLSMASIAGLWQGAVLALMGAALMRLMPRASASLRYGLLVAIFAMTTVLP